MGADDGWTRDQSILWSSRTTTTGHGAARMTPRETLPRIGPCVWAPTTIAGASMRRSTSMAAPYVAGLVSYMLADKPDLTIGQIRQRIRSHLRVKRESEQRFKLYRHSIRYRGLQPPLFHRFSKWILQPRAVAALGPHFAHLSSSVR